MSDTKQPCRMGCNGEYHVSVCENNPARKYLFANHYAHSFRSEYEQRRAIEFAMDWHHAETASLRSQLSECQRENERLKTDAQFAGMAVERAEAAEQQVATLTAERERWWRCPNPRCYACGNTDHPEPTCVFCGTLIERDAFARFQQQLQQMKEALVLCMEPLEAIRMSVQWELCEDIKQAVIKATDSARALLSGKE